MRIDRVKLIAEMARRDLTTLALAEKSGISRITICSMRSGKSVREDSAVRVAAAMGLSLDDIKEG